MKKLIQILVLLLMVQSQPFAQNVPIGTWRFYFPYAQSKDLALSSSRLYSAAEMGVLVYNLEDHSVEKWDKNWGLSDYEINHLAFDANSNLLVLAYENGNIDLVDGQENVYNLPDINELNSPGDKSIYNIYFDDKFVYLATGFGIEVIDKARKEFKETYRIGNSGESIAVYQVSMDNNNLYAATDQGLKYIALSNPNKQSYVSWSTYGTSENLTGDAATFILNVNGTMVCMQNDSLMYLQAGSWVKFYEDTAMSIENLDVVNNQLYISNTYLSSGAPDSTRLMIFDNNFTSYNVQSIPQSLWIQKVIGNNNQLFLADKWKGLLKYENEQTESLSPNGPSLSVFDLASRDNDLFLASGSVNESWGITWNGSGTYQYKDGWWSNHNLYNTNALQACYDVITVCANPNNQEVYYGSFTNGFIVQNGDEFILFNKYNSILEGQSGDSARTKITDIKVDQNGNVWITNFGSDKVLAVKRTDGEWYSFNIHGVNNVATHLLVDSYGQKWVAYASSGGITVFDEGDDWSNAADDRRRNLSTGNGSGNLTNTRVNCMVEDNEGEIWVGSEEGITIFYCPGSIFDGCEAQSPIVERDGYNGYLFETQNVNDIAVDGGNRKWIATYSGAWLISADGKEELMHFNKENSPLPANAIRDIEINHKTGEVFFATEKGLVSYQGDATISAYEHQDVLVYPNPVFPDFQGEIAIKGLTFDSNIKITDAFGGLIYEGKANGSTAVWNGKDYNGRKAKAGVYLVFSLNNDGKEKYCAKIVILSNQ